MLIRGNSTFLVRALRINSVSAGQYSSLGITIKGHVIWTVDGEGPPFRFAIIN